MNKKDEEMVKTEELKQLGIKIKQIREKKKMTLNQLGKKMGYSGATISRWERGLKEPKYSAIVSLEKALKIKLTSLKDVMPNDTEQSLTPAEPSQAQSVVAVDVVAAAAAGAE